jgi:hypothetical protein
MRYLKRSYPVNTLYPSEFAMQHCLVSITASECDLYLHVSKPPLPTFKTDFPTVSGNLIARVYQSCHLSIFLVTTPIFLRNSTPGIQRPHTFDQKTTSCPKMITRRLGIWTTGAGRRARDYGNDLEDIGQSTTEIINIDQPNWGPAEGFRENYQNWYITHSTQKLLTNTATGKTV